MKVLSKLVSIWERALDILIGIMMVVLCVMIGAQIVSRFVFNKPIIWTEEASRWLMIWMAFMSIPVCVKKGIHLKVDLGIDAKLSPMAKMVKNIIFNLLALAVWVLIVKFSYTYAMTLTRVNALTFRVPKVYLLICIPISGVFTVVFLINKVVEAIATYRSESGAA